MRWIILGVLMLTLTSCAKTALVDGDLVAEAPRMVVGDRWSYEEPFLNEDIEYQVVDVKENGAYTLLVNVGRQTLTVERDASSNEISREGKAPGSKVWDLVKFIDYPLFVGKRYTSSFTGFTRAGTEALFHYNFSVSHIEHETFAGAELQLFVINFSISTTDGFKWASNGKIYYSPELKSIVRVKREWRADSELAAFQVAPGAIHSFKAGKVSALPTATTSLAYGFQDNAGASERLALEREKITMERKRLAAAQQQAEAQLEKARDEAARMKQEVLAEVEREAERLAREKMLAEQQKLEQAMEEKQRAMTLALQEKQQQRGDAARQAAQKLAEENNKYGIAVIIGNRNYSKQNSDVPDVDYAHNDAQAMLKHVRDDLGFREGNIIYLEDATQADLSSVFGNERTYKGKLFSWVTQGKSKVFIYYSGHGAPDLSEGRGYLLPVDADPMMVELNGYPLDTLYKNLAKIPAQQITVVLDACFSGSSPQGSLVKSASSIALRRVQSDVMLKNGVVLSAADVSEVASWDTERKHGLFTSLYLDGVAGKADDQEYGDGDGKVLLGELKRFLQDKVRYAARRNYHREQNPQISGDEQLLMGSHEL